MITEGLRNERMKTMCELSGFADESTPKIDDNLEPRNSVQASEIGIFNYTNQYKISGPARLHYGHSQ